jgi:hypothetical protein
VADFVFHSAQIAEKELTIRDARYSPFAIHGLYKPEEPGLFKRMPQDVAENTSKRVRLLYNNTAGARLRFATDATCIAVGAIYPPMEFPSARTAAFACAGAFSFDMYADGKYCRVLWPEKVVQNGSVVSFDLSDGQYEAFITFGEKKMRQITLNFPSFVNISQLYIGLTPDARLEPARAYRNEKPVVFYGSSITQGACASHPGNIYQNILSRKLDIDYINLGFASGCKAEDTIIDYLCGLEMSMMVFDYDHNAKSPEFLRDTHLPALRKLRAAHPDIPFILISRPNIDAGVADTLRRVEVIEESYRALQADGCGPVHFVNGYEIFQSHDSEMMTIDGTHPTDLGFYCMAEAIYDVMQPYFP